MNRVGFTIGFVATLLAFSSARGAGVPSVSKSEYFSTKGAGFPLKVDEQMNIRSCSYWLALTPRKVFTVPLYLRAEFENPTNASRPFIVDAVVQPDERDD